MPERFSNDADIETGVERKETPTIPAITDEEHLKSVATSLGWLNARNTINVAMSDLRTSQSGEGGENA